MSAEQRNVLSLKKGDSRTDSQLAERLHKVMANAGLGSRRMLETRIADGEITVNGTAAELGSSVSAGDTVQLDGRQFVVVTDHGDDAEVLALNKDEGVLTTRDDPEGRPTIFTALPDPRGKRWIAVGRLDINTSGLLLLTTDGELANALMHPSSEVEREYLCRVQGEVPAEALAQLLEGVELEDGPGRFQQIIALDGQGSHAWFRVVLSEGRNREVRRLWEAVGCTVSRLKRIRYGSISLPRSLKRGQHQALDVADIANLRKQAGIDKPATTLTLRPVARQRRAAVAVKPPRRAPAAWTGAARDERRELTPWDRPRGSRPERSPRRGRGKGKDVDGNVLEPEGNKTRPRKSRRKAAPGQELPSVRSWFAGDDRGGGRGGNKGKTDKPQRRSGPPRSGRGGKPHGNRRGPGKS